MLLKQQPIWRAIARVVFLVLLTLLLLHNGIVPYQPLHSTGTPVRDVIAGTLKIAWWVWAAWFLVALIRSVVVFERRPREGKLVQDLLSALIYLAAAFAIIAYVFDLPVQGLLATSGVIAIVLGLALQSTLNDVFSGVVLSLSRPYRPGGARGLSSLPSAHASSSTTGVELVVAMAGALGSSTPNPMANGSGHA
jgi:small-conductance mechanosensitive channel